MKNIVKFSRKSQENGPEGRKKEEKKDRKSNGSRHKNKTGNSKVESNNSFEIPDGRGGRHKASPASLWGGQVSNRCISAGIYMQAKSSPANIYLADGSTCTSPPDLSMSSPCTLCLNDQDVSICTPPPDSSNFISLYNVSKGLRPLQDMSSPTERRDQN